MFVAMLIAAGVGCEDNSFQAPPPPTVIVAEPAQRPVTEYASLIGSTRAVASSDIRARVGGILEEIVFENGAMVEKGDVLFVLDQEPFIAARDAAAAQLESAKAQASLAEATAARIERSAADGAISQVRADEATAQAEVAAAAVKVAERELAIRQLDVDDSQITAPRRGLIQKADINEGDLINPQGQDGLLATIFDDTQVDVWFTVPDRVYLGVIRAGERGGDPATIEIATELDEGFPYTGVVDYADPVADEQTGTIRVRAKVPNEDRKLVGGLFVRIRIPIGEMPAALLVPEAAISNDQVGSFLLVVGEGDVVERRNVKLGPLDNGERVVVEGLTPTDRVVVSGLLRARPGAPVTPTTRDQAAAGSDNQ